MSVRIGTALREGGRRTFTRDGLVLVFAFVLIGLVSAVAAQTLLADAFDTLLELMWANRGTGEGEFTREQIRTVEAFVSGQTPLALSIPTSGAWALIALTAVLAEAATVVAIRVFFAADTALSGAVIRHNLPFATLNGIVGGIVVLLIVAIGLLFLIVPGVFLAITFLFLRQEIAVEDTNFVDGMADSWQLAKGNRLKLFALVVGVVVIVLVVSTVVPAVFGAVSPVVGLAVGVVSSGVTAVFGTAVVTRAYAQLHAERAAVRSGEDRADADERAAY